MGAGEQVYWVNRKSGQGSYLYLPKKFTPDRRWPLVVTLHGMKPFDTAKYQIDEWEGMADKHGFVVIAPVLRSPDVFNEFPLRDSSSPALLQDELAVINLIHELSRSCPINPDRILLTSWSSGGYVLHYLMNRRPDIFAAVVARESNFHPDLLNVANVPRYRDKPILIFYGQLDFPGVKAEAKRSAEWYRSRGFRKLKEREIPGLGHQRRPDIASDFFIDAVGLKRDDIEIVADPVVGPVPLTVALSVRVPSRFGRPTGYQWRFGPTDVLGPTSTEASHTIEEPGHYPVEVAVEFRGKTRTARLKLLVLPSERN